MTLLKLLILVFLPAVFQAANAQDTPRPKIGLTLSGGGAKGLAHIGILKAIDSAGLKVDYITGTSMGSVVGSLYAIGYSGKDIEAIARKLDWRLLLTNQTSMRSLSMEEKDEYSKYAIELPYSKGRFSLPTGALEAQELWIKLSELYFPVYHIKQFENFPIPFKCIATDIANADVVVQDRGEIITAIRASMAIPGVFTTVDNFDRKLVDGGVVRNFPVSDVKEMGADIVIGSNVSHGLFPKEQLTNPAQILVQISFFKNAEGLQKQIELCDYYIDHHFKNYSTGSFDKANEIIDTGNVKGDSLYPVFKRLADSLNQLYGKPSVKKMDQPKSVFITSFEVKGLKKMPVASFLRSINFQPLKSYTVDELSNMIRRASGTRYYNYIHYTLLPEGDNKALISFEVEENTPTFSKLGIHYNTFTGISLISNFTTRNYFSPNSRSFMTFNIGENFRFRAEHLQYIEKSKRIALIPNIQFESLKVNTYDNFKKDGLYRQNYFKAEVKLQSAVNRNHVFGAGTSYVWVQYRPTIQSVLEANGRNQFLTSFAYYHLNTLDKPLYPDKGVKLKAELGQIYHQRQKLFYSSRGVIIDTPDSLDISSDTYTQASLNMEFYSPVASKLTLSGLFQSGINFDSHQNIFNAFSVGGLNRMYRNQVLFPGLQDMTIFSHSVASMQLALRYRLFPAFFLIGQSGVLANNFLGNENQLQKPKWLTGYAITFAYRSLLGPIELSGMYCDQSRSLQTYVTIGFSF